MILNVAWTVFYPDMSASPWVGGILTAAGLWYALKLSSRLKGSMIAFLSLLAGSAVGMGSFIILATAWDLLALPYYSVGLLWGQFGCGSY